jgi:hypothetical protein
MRLTLYALFTVLAALAACAGVGDRPQSYLATFGLRTTPTPAEFDVCRSFACAATTPARLNSEEWEQVRALFDPPPAGPWEERAVAARAIGLLEELVGPQAGTSLDQPRNEEGPDGANQLDCVAEAANSTVYLLLMERDGLLAFHQVAHPAQRGFLVFFPHNTAVLLEKESGKAFALDSWYRANGRPALVWALDLWQTWKADGNNAENGDPEDEAGAATIAARTRLAPQIH